ncbi:MAG: hypothetical protein ACJ746_26055 [Bryobacteraceae bacterium]
MTVQAAFSNEHLSELMDLSPGQIVSVSCRVRGMVLGSVNSLIVEQGRAKNLLSDEHFTLDGTLIEA